MRIPWQQLSEDALIALIEEFVSREGTEYGSVDVSVTDKVAQVRQQLKREEVFISYDPESGTTSIEQSQHS